MSSIGMQQKKMESKTSHWIEFIPRDSTISESSGSRRRKRAACDRCRGQKVKCTLEDEGADVNSNSRKCIRCKAANTSCAFGISRRNGRPSASSDTGPPRKRRREGKHARLALNWVKDGGGGQDCLEQSRREDQFEAQPGENGDTLPSGNDKEVENGKTVFAGDVAAKSLSSISESVPETLGTPNEELFTLPTFFESSDAGLLWDEGGDIFDLIDPAFLEPNSDPSDWAFSQDQRELDRIQRPKNVSARNDHQTQNTDLSDNEFFIDSPPTNGQSSASPGTAIDHTSTNGSTYNSQVASPWDQEKNTRNNTNIDFTPKNASSGDGSEAESRPSIKSSQSALSGKSAQCHRMQELSQLGANLNSLVLANEAKSHEATITESPSSLKDEFVAKVLQSSASFLCLLESFYPSTTLPSGKGPVFTSVDGDALTFDEAAISSDRATDEISCQSIGIDSGASDLPSKNVESKPESADMATILQLLTCYIGLIDLHGILYSRVIAYLTASPRHNDARLLSPIFLNMQVGGVSLDKVKRTFQAKLLLQLSTHVLGEIEMALGIPNGFRVSGKHLQRQGILEASVSVQFVEMALREHGRRDVLEFEGDRFQRVRNHLATLRQLTKNTIRI